MLKKLIKTDRNEFLESVLEKKDIDLKTRNLLQGILYKIEVSYADYRKAKVIGKSEKKYVDEIIYNINKNCNKIITISFNEKVGNQQIQEKLEKNKFFINSKGIITYPIEEKLLYAIERKSNNKKIVSSKYGILSETLSELILTGKCIDRVEVLRDFNGWSWTTIKQEIENVRANLIYQILQILEGEEFLENWTKDIGGIIDYIDVLKKDISKKYGGIYSEKIDDTIKRISILDRAENDFDFKKENTQKIAEINAKINARNNLSQYIVDLTEKKKKAEKAIAETQIILSSEKSIKEEMQKRNEELPIDKQIFSVKLVKKELVGKVMDQLNTIDEINTELNPNNYQKIKDNVFKEKSLYEAMYYTDEEKQGLYIEFINTFLDCFMILVKQANSFELMKLIYKFRYFMLLPFDGAKNIKDIEELENKISEVEKEMLKISKKQKIVSDKVPYEVWTHIFETRIINLEELYYEIFAEYDKKYVQIFDNKVSEEKFLIENIEKNKMNKKIRIFE